MNNAELLARLDAAFKGITTSGTLSEIILNPQQFNRYVRMLQLSTTILPESRQVIMTAEKQDVDRIGFGGRVMRKPNATEGEPLDQSKWATPITEKVQLDAVEVQGVVSLTDKAARRTIEKGNFENTLVDLFGEQAGIDLEELALKGDKNSSDEYLTLLDGWLITANRRVQNVTNDDISGNFTTGVGETTQDVDHGQDGVPIIPGTWTLEQAATLVAHDDGNGVIVQDNASGISGTIEYNGGKVSLAGLTQSLQYDWDYDQKSYDPAGDAFPEDMFEAMLVAAPKEYFRMPSQWRFYVPWYIENAYRDLLKGRGTALGDEAQTAARPLAYKGVPVRVAHHVGDGRSMLAHPDNLIHGIFHEVQLEREREAKAKRTDWILNTEFDVKHEEKEATIVAMISGP